MRSEAQALTPIAGHHFGAGRHREIGLDLAQGHWLALAMAATLVSTLHGGPQFLYALFFGVAFHYLSQDPKTRPGIEFCSRTVLRVGVGLLGARITASQIAGLGWSTAAIVIAAVVTTLLCGVLLGRFLGLNRAQSVLSGGAVAICGASAALARNACADASASAAAAMPKAAARTSRGKTFISDR